MEPEPSEGKIYIEHLVRLLVVTELLNTFFRSKQLDIGKLRKMLEKWAESSKSPLEDSGPELLLRLRLSDRAVHALVSSE